MAKQLRSALVVDDDATIRNLVTLILLRESYEVETAADGIEAVLKLGLHDYDIIILDLMMPSLSGRNVMEYLEEEHVEMLPRVIVLTAAGETEIERMVSKHACAVVRKPFDVPQFAETVRRCAATVTFGGGSGDTSTPVG